MGRFIRRQLTYFLWGFIAAFVLYLFIRFDPGKVLAGLAISAAAGVATCIVILYLEHKFFSDEPKAAPLPPDKT